jgi:hypothetical protein
LLPILLGSDVLGTCRLSIATTQHTIMPHTLSAQITAGHEADRLWNRQVSTLSLIPAGVAELAFLARLLIRGADVGASGVADGQGGTASRAASTA